MRWISNCLASCRQWRSTKRSRKITGHKRRQDAAFQRAGKLATIQADTPEETFSRRIAYLRRIDPLIFEELVLDAFQRRGWKVERNIRYTGDGGLDGKVFRDGRWHGVQCKRYRSFIQARHVAQFSRDLPRFGLDGGFFVHTGRTPSTLRPPQGVALISGRKLLDFLLHPGGEEEQA